MTVYATLKGGGRKALDGNIGESIEEVVQTVETMTGRTVTGSAVPDLSLPGADGEAIRFSDITGFERD